MQINITKFQVYVNIFLDKYTYIYIYIVNLRLHVHGLVQEYVIKQTCLLNKQTQTNFFSSPARVVHKQLHSFTVLVSLERLSNIGSHIMY